MLDNLHRFWCVFMHNDLKWPMHGQYQCRICGRSYAVPWAERGSTAPAVRQMRLPPLLSALMRLLFILAILHAPRLRATQPAVVNAFEGAAAPLRATLP
jgi:hypothetical protein